jgi:amino acid transporter
VGGWPDDLPDEREAVMTGPVAESAARTPARPIVGPGLRRELRFAETTAVSVGVMAPTLAMSVTGVAAAEQLGRAAPLAFVFAGLGVGLVAFGFVRLAAAFSSAGSVYAFVGNALSPRWGFVAGWALLGTYLVFPTVSIMGITVFGRAFLSATGLAADADWYPIALVGWAVIALLAGGGIRPTARALLLFEIVSVLLIIVLMVAIVVRLVSGGHPVAGSGGISGRVFVLPAGTGAATLALAATSGFLAFAGFESAGSLGEESLRPRREIPRAIWTAVAFGAVFYVACMVTQSLGFGLGRPGVAAFRNSQAPLGDLAQHFVGTALATLLDAGAVLSAVGAGLGGVTVAARMIYVFGRDGVTPAMFGRVSARTGVPMRALTAELAVGLALLTGFRLAGTAPLDVFFYLATLGVLSLLIMYMLTNVAAVRRLERNARGEAVFSVLGVGIAGYVLYRNVWPQPAAPYRYLPYGVLGWLVLGLVLTVAVPGLVAKVGAGLGRRIARE